MSASEALGSDSRLRRYDSLLEMIGNTDDPTPMVSLRRVAPDGVALYAKLEWMNPFGSVKDRTAKWLLAAAEREGLLDGRGVLEPTSGNTGIALAAIAQLLGHPMTAAVPLGMPVEKEVLLRVLGATVVHTPPDADPGRHPMDVAMDVAERMIAENPGAFHMPNQYDNPENVRAHYESTGPEIWKQTEGRVRYFIAGVGTTGTITGAGRFLKECDPDVRVIAVEPVPGHHISGLKNLEETAVPGILDRSVIDEVVYVDDEQTAEMARRLHCEEALFAGSSGAAIVAGALHYLEGRSGTAVAIIPDSSQKAASYLGSILEAE